MTKQVAVPSTKLSAAILEFAAPLLDLYAPMPTEEEARGVLFLAVAVWNANVMASPVWGKPHHREELLAKIASCVAPPFPALLQDLDRTWHERYSDDPRFVGEWSFGVDEAGGTTLVCPALLPNHVTANVAPSIGRAPTSKDASKKKRAPARARKNG